MLSLRIFAAFLPTLREIIYGPKCIYNGTLNAHPEHPKLK